MARSKRNNWTRITPNKGVRVADLDEREDERDAPKPSHNKKPANKNVKKVVGNAS